MTALSPPPVVHLVDNDPHVLKAVSRVLASAGYRTQACTSTQEFFAHFDASVPGCLVLDMTMPGSSGLDLQHALRERQVSLPIVFLSGCAEVPECVEAMKGGALDFLTKPVDADVLVSAVRRGIETDERQRAQSDANRAMREHLQTLTPREREILPWLVSGKLNKQIAGELGVVEKTVKVHRAHVMHKLGVRSLAELVRLAARAGVEPRGAATASNVGPTAN